MWSKISLFSLVIGRVLLEASKPKVCVIGAGMSGLASVKQLAEHCDEIQPVVFERNSDVGGLWIYTDRSNLDDIGLFVHSSAYKNLRTNTPKEIMTYPDYQKFYGRENRSHVLHDSVLEYLRNYTAHFSLRQYIQFNTLVEKVEFIENRNGQLPKWKVRTRDMNSLQKNETICNYIMVCNGQFSVPRIPDIAGIETFTGRVLHSHDYRRPEDFRGQTVLVLGASASGTDISEDLSPYAETVYLSHRYEVLPIEVPRNVMQVYGVIGANGNQLILENNSSVSADALIYCTGYLRSFPFLDSDSGIEVDDNYVYPLYRHLLNVEHPSMAFVGIPSTQTNAALHYMQAKYFTALIRRRFGLPIKWVMFENARRNQRKPKRISHLLGDTEGYYDDLAKEARLPKLPKFYRIAEEATFELVFEHPSDHKEYDLQQLANGSVVFYRRQDD